jgi:hypothetical protein
MIELEQKLKAEIDSLIVQRQNALATAEQALGAIKSLEWALAELRTAQQPTVELTTDD